MLSKTKSNVLLRRATNASPLLRMLKQCFFLIFTLDINPSTDENGILG